MSTNEKLGAGVVLLIAIALIFLCVDCCAGRNRYFESRVRGHHYEPPWTEVSSYTDSDGQTHLTTTYHSETFHVICQELPDGHQFDCVESRATYYAVSDGQDVTVRTREGKWTGRQWLPSVETK